MNSFEKPVQLVVVTLEEDIKSSFLWLIYWSIYWFLQQWRIPWKNQPDLKSENNMYIPYVSLFQFKNNNAPLSY